MIRIDNKDYSYRPFKNGDEFWKEMLRHHPVGWIQDKNNKNLKIQITMVPIDSYVILHYPVRDPWGNTDIKFQFNELIERFEFIDGYPCGIKLCYEKN